MNISKITKIIYGVFIGASTITFALFALTSFLSRDVNNQGVGFGIVMMLGSMIDITAVSFAVVYIWSVASILIAMRTKKRDPLIFNFIMFLVLSAVLIISITLVRHNNDEKSLNREIYCNNIASSQAYKSSKIFYDSACPELSK